MNHVVCVLKTNEGGLWAIPQVEELRRRGHQVTVLLPPGRGRLRLLLEERRIEVSESEFDFSFRPSYRLVRGLLGLRRQIKSLKPDVAFYHLYASALAVRVGTLMTGVRRVHMVAGPLYLDSKPIRAVERFLCKLDDVVIAGSEHTAQRYRGLGMPPARVKAIPYGVDLNRYGPEAVTPLDRDESVFTVIMVAYFYAPKSSVYRGVGIKGHELLINAWRAFVADHPDSRLLLVGAGFDEAGELHRASLKEGCSGKLGDSVRWIDSVSDVRGWYASADVSVSPSLSENHGAALEASAMACPSIVSDAGALPETVEPGVSGWIVPAGNVGAIESALGDARTAWEQGRLKEMGVAARRHVEAHFNQQVCTQRVADVVAGQ